MMEDGKNNDTEQVENSTQEKENLETNEETVEEEASEEVDADAAYKELNDKFVRLYSDFDNFRKRTAKEKVDLINNASENIIKELLSVLDDFERAKKSNEETPDVDGLKEGFNLIHHKLQMILEAKGLKKMTSKEQGFDLDMHEAVTNIPAPSEDLKGKVVDVVEEGYYLNEKVIRYAKVVVGE